MSLIIFDRFLNKVCCCERPYDVDMLQRKVEFIAKVFIILHIIVSTILFNYFKAYLIAWIPVIIPILCLYNGAHNKKRKLLIPFMLAMVLVETMVMFFSFIYIVYCLNYGMIPIGINTTYYRVLFLAGPFLLGLVNFVTVWIQLTTHKFYSSIGTNSCNEPAYEYRTYIPNPITQRQNPIFRRTIDIVRSNTRNEHQNLNMNNLEPRNDSRQENLSLNDDSSESKQDLPPSYINIITSSGDGFMQSPPSYTDAMKNEQITK